MAKQKAYVRINSSKRCWYEIVEFEVSDDLYAKINEAVENNIPLADCDFADALYELAEKSLNTDEIVEPDFDKPYPDEFEDEVEYEEALEEYRAECEEIFEDVEVEEISIYDPGDLTRLKKKFVGKKLKNHSDDSVGLQSIFLEYDNEKYETYRVDITFKENGIITDITVDAMGLQYHDFRSDNYAECYPNYEYIEDALQDAVEM
nr:hypothetical protein [Ruminococcus sp.]